MLIDEFGTQSGWGIRPKPVRAHNHWRKVMSKPKRYEPTDGQIELVVTRTIEAINDTMHNASGSDRVAWVDWASPEGGGALRKVIRKVMEGAAVRPEEGRVNG